MNRLTGFLIIFVFVLALGMNLPTPTRAAAATLSMSPAVGTFNKGCSFSLDVKVDTGGTQTDGTDAIIFYDQTRFSARAIRNGTIYQDYPGNNIDSQTGKITISGLSSVSSAFSGSGTLASIDFTVLDTAPPGATQIKFDFDINDKTKTIDSNVVERGTVADILSQVNNGNYTIGTGTGCSGVVEVTPTVVQSGLPRGGTDSTPSATTFIPQPTLVQTADFGTTMVLVAVGSLLTIAGILGLALL